MRLYRALYSLVCTMQVLKVFNAYLLSKRVGGISKQVDKLTGKRTASNTKRHL